MRFNGLARDIVRRSKLARNNAVVADEAMAIANASIKLVRVVVKAFGKLLY